MPRSTSPGLGVTEDFLEQVTSDSALGGGVKKLVQSSGSDIQGPGFKSPLSHLLHVTQASDSPPPELRTGEMAVPTPRAVEGVSLGT